jgi:hypothetical protein
MDIQNQDSIFLLIISTILLVLLAVIVINVLLVSRNRRLKDEAILLETKAAYEKEILNTRLEVAEATLQEIAGDLHDDVGQMLTLAIIQLNRLEIESDLVVEAKEAVKSGLESVRSISRILSPEYLQSFGINQALVRLQERINKQQILHLNLEIYNSISWLNREQELYVFRILQELVTNTIKYAEAKQVFIKISMEGSNISVEYIDDGKGFQPEDAENGMGMINIQRRIELMGGNLKIQSERDGGLNVVFSLKNK